MDNHLIHLNLRKVPQKLDKTFRNIVHATSLKSALQILNNREIFGDFYDYSTDSKPLHANFFVSPRKNFDLARHREVLMHFCWDGEQCATAYNMVGRRGEQAYTNMLFHVYTSDGESYFDFEKNYWQSLLFPGSRKLRFTKITVLSDERCILHSIWLHHKINRINRDYANTPIEVI